MAFSISRLARSVRENKPFTEIGKNIGAAILAADEKKKLGEAQSAYEKKLTVEPILVSDAEIQEYNTLIDKPGKTVEEDRRIAQLKDKIDKAGFTPSLPKVVTPSATPEAPKTPETPTPEVPKTPEVSTGDLAEQFKGLQQAAQTKKVNIQEAAKKAAEAATKAKKADTMSRIEALSQTLAEHPEAARAGFGKEELEALKLRGSLEAAGVKTKRQELEDKAQGDYIDELNAATTFQDKKAAADKFAKIVGKAPIIAPFDLNTKDPKEQAYLRQAYPKTYIAAQAQQSGADIARENLDIRQEELDIRKATTALEMKKTQAEIDKLKKETSNPKPLSDVDRSWSTAFNDFKRGVATIEKLISEGFDPTSVEALNPLATRTQLFKTAKQAVAQITQQDWTGASAAQLETARIEGQIPRLLDTPETIAEKMKVLRSKVELGDQMINMNPALKALAAGVDKRPTSTKDRSGEF